MADLTLSFDAVSVPANASASVTVYEDVGADGSGPNTDPNGRAYDNAATVSLSDGTTSYSVSGFDGGTGNDYWLETEFENTDITVAASSDHPATLSFPLAVGGTIEAAATASGEVTSVGLLVSGTVEAAAAASGGTPGLSSDGVVGAQADASGFIKRFPEDGRYRITITGLDGSTVADTEQVFDASLSLEHSALSEATVVLRGSEVSFGDVALGTVDIELNGQTLFVGEATRVREDRPTDRLVEITAAGPAYDLTREAPDAEVSFSNERRVDAIDSYWSNQTGVTATVAEPTPEIQEDDTRLRSVADNESFSSEVSLADDQPVLVDGNVLRPAQTCYVAVDDDDFTGLYTLVSSDNQFAGEYYIDLEAGDLGPGDDISATFTPEYEIPADRVGIAYRLVGVSGSGDASDLTITFNQDSFNAQFTEDWNDVSADYSGGFLNDGSQVDFQFSIDSSSSLECRFDAVAIYDQDHAPTQFDTPPGDLTGEVDGPSLFPRDQTVDLTDELRSFNVREARIESTFNDVSSGQQLALANNDTDPPLTFLNTETATADFDANSNYGFEVRPEITFSAFGTLPWLTRRAEPQEISSYKLFATTDNTRLISSLSLSGSHFENLQELHDDGYRFVVDPRETNPIVADSFLSGNEAAERGADWITLDASRDRDTRGYANQISLTFTDAETNTQREFTFRDFGEVDEKGSVVEKKILTTDTLTRDEARVRAFAALAEAVATDQSAGEVEAASQFILPGFDYTVDEFGGDVVPLERVRFSEDGGSFAMSLNFGPERDFVAQVIENALDNR